MTRAKPPVVFFGYPFRPTIRGEAVVEAARRLREEGAIVPKIWERLSTSGRFVIDVILVTIDEADLAAFDVTELNHNVMFEVGYAIGKDRRIWLLRDETNKAAKRNWDKIKILTTLGYSQFTNSDHIVQSFRRQNPAGAAETVFQSAVKGYLRPAGPPGLLYLPSLHETEAGRKLTRRVHKERQRGLLCIVADPDESSVQSLAWYAQQIYSSEAVVAHFCSPTRFGAEVHNARCALVSGLARGMGKDLLMLAEEDYATPIDYRDLLYVYPTVRHCLDHTDEWLHRHLRQAYEDAGARRLHATATTLAVELDSLRIGDPVAENEADDLADYFIETASFHEVLEKNTAVFVGRKGTGKTANLLSAAATLRTDKRNLVCLIKPFSYELEAVVKLMRQYQERADQGYLVESLWKFLIYSEIANAAYGEIRERPVVPVPRSPEGDFADYMEGPAAFLRDEFAVRLESVVDRLLALAPQSTIAGQRTQISRALHDGVLRQLREHLGRVLSEKQRVAVLIDNLDKAWQRTADIPELASFLLGLLSSIGRISDDFAASDHWRKPVAVTLAVFLRSDIYAHVARIAREPDKIPVSRLVWADKALLLRVIEERFEALQGAGAHGSELWTRFFCATTRGIMTPDYILSRVLPTPRDLIYFCSAAIASAVNRRSPKIEEEDILKAETFYSQFAFEALQVGNGVSMEELERILYEFAGGPSIVDSKQVAQYVTGAGITEERATEVIQHLHWLSFLGLEIEQDHFDFAYELRAPALADALAGRHAVAAGGLPRYEIHPAFRSYLEIEETWAGVPAHLRALYPFIRFVSRVNVGCGAHPSV